MENNNEYHLEKWIYIFISEIMAGGVIMAIDELYLGLKIIGLGIIVMGVLSIINYQVSKIYNKQLKDLELKKDKKKLTEFKTIVDVFFKVFKKVPNDIDEINKMTGKKMSNYIEGFKTNFEHNLLSPLGQLCKELKKIEYFSNQEQFLSYQARFKSSINDFEVKIEELKNEIRKKKLLSLKCQWKLHELKIITHKIKHEKYRFF